MTSARALPRRSPERTEHLQVCLQPARGTQREVALAFAGPLREVSMAVRLDRPRAWVESATGREHATIDTEIVLPPPLPAETTPVTGRGSPRCRPASGRRHRRARSPRRSRSPPGTRCASGSPATRSSSRPVCGLPSLRTERRRGDGWGRRRPRRHRSHPPGRLQLVPARHRAGREEEDPHGRLLFRGNDDHDLMTGLPRESRWTGSAARSG